MKKQFLEFLIQKETPPKRLAIESQKDILLSFRKTSILLKFVVFQLLGALFSMSVCPQFGLGLVEGHGIAHMFKMMGDPACAAFCGSLFLSSGMFAAYLGMKGEELWWVWKRYKWSLILLPALMWGGLMFTNMSLNLRSEAPSFHVVWILAAIFAEVILLQLRSGLYVLRISR